MQVLLKINRPQIGLFFLRIFLNSNLSEIKPTKLSANANDLLASFDLPTGYNKDNTFVLSAFVNTGDSLSKNTAGISSIEITSTKINVTLSSGWNNRKVSICICKTN